MDLAVPVIGILRGISGDFFGDLMDAAFGAGLQALEVTLNTDGAEAMIAAQRQRVPEGGWLGMGTVCNVRQARRAIDAGAMFLVTPNCDPDVIAHGAAADVPVVAGALTPTEVYNAWSAGAAMVKVFPCRPMGPGYIRDLLGPFDHIKLAAVGGVNAGNVNDFFAAGAHAVGVGTSLFGKEALARRRPDAIAANIRRFLGALSSLK
jgi:2-dehydro-3-deoxyphosphogluconate aldolase/(4S)-4-hydroxy-2-oxoglutarate aldolase